MTHQSFSWPAFLQKRKTAVLLLLLLLLSLGLRVGVMLLRDVPAATTRRQVMAEQLLTQGELVYCGDYFPFCTADNQVTASVEPLPVLVFAGLIWLFGDGGLWAAVIGQNLLGLATAVLLYQISQQVVGKTAVSLLATFLWATYLPMINLTLYLEAELIFTFFLLLGVWALLHSLRSNNHQTWVATGLCFGLATLSRSILLYFPFGLLLIGLISYKKMKQQAIGITLALLTFALTLTPWVIRNQQTFNSFIPGNTLLGYNLFRHNHFLGDADYLHYGYAKETVPVINQLIANSPELRGNENEVEMDAFYKHEALKIIKAYPLRYLHLSLYRVVALWTDFEIQQGSLFWQLIALQNIALLLLACSHLMRQRRLTAASAVLILLILYFSGTHSLVNGRLRYLMPIIPLVMTLAAAEITHLFPHTIHQLLPRWRTSKTLPKL